MTEWKLESTIQISVQRRRLKVTLHFIGIFLIQTVNFESLIERILSMVHVSHNKYELSLNFLPVYLLFSPLYFKICNRKR